jgi:hypothetical protein
MHAVTFLQDLAVIMIVRIAPKVLLPARGAEERLNDTLCQKSGYPGRNG